MHVKEPEAISAVNENYSKPCTVKAFDDFWIEKFEIEHVTWEIELEIVVYLSNMKSKMCLVGCHFLLLDQRNSAVFVISFNLT